MGDYVIEAKRGTDKWKALVAAWNQGIDSYLEAFCKSKFVEGKNYRNDVFRFDRSELKTLTRRLKETEDPVSVGIADDIARTQELDDFTRAYIVAGLWSTGGDTVEYLDERYGPQDLSPEAMDRIKKDCEDFKTKHADLLKDMDMTQAGHDFWLTRNGHGCGFWDRDLGELGDKLTEVCGRYGNIDLYEGDDGKLYF